jgi:putative DNA primase/helicase
MPVGPASVFAADSEPLILDPSNPLEIARTFAGQSYTVDGVLALRHQGGVFYEHQRTVSAYRDRDDAAIRADAYKFLEGAQQRAEVKSKQPAGLTPFKPTKAKVDNTLDALRAVCNIPTSLSAPCWLTPAAGHDPHDIIAFTNGLLALPGRELLPATPEFFTLNGLDFPFEPSAPPPTHFLRFLEDLWPDDPESPATLQEFLGYLLTPRTQFQKMLMLVGPKRSGKGTIGRVARRLLGERNVCGPTLANMSEQFGLSILIGKSAAIIADARISGRTDTSVITERLLSISGEDTLSIPRKFLPDWNGKLSTRFLLMTNELPRIEDASGALASRFVVLTLHQSFYGREDHELLNRFIPELPGILNWALDGWDRLRARGRFLQPQASAELIQQFEDLGSPIGAFLRERCDIGTGHDVAQQRLFDAWKSWCQESGRERPGTTQSLGKNLRAAVPWLKVTHPRVLGTPVRYWEGLRLKAQGAD